jgi:hypothetical protein
MTLDCSLARRSDAVTHLLCADWIIFSGSYAHRPSVMHAHYWHKCFSCPCSKRQKKAKAGCFRGRAAVMQHHHWDAARRTVWASARIVRGQATQLLLSLPQRQHGVVDWANHADATQTYPPPARPARLTQPPTTYHRYTRPGRRPTHVQYNPRPGTISSFWYGGSVEHEAAWVWVFQASSI